MTRLALLTGTIYFGFNLVTLSTRVLKEVNISDPGVLKGVNFQHAPFGALERGLIPVSCEGVF